MKIKVIYLARLSEDLGKKEEILELPDSGLTIKDIFLKLNLDKFEYKILPQVILSTPILNMC